VAALGQRSEGEFAWVEGFLENSRADWDRDQFRTAIEEYFDKILLLMRSSSRLDDLR